MKNLLIKDFRLSASALTYGFLAASLMTMLPGYPILMGAFFICLGIFHSFQCGPHVFCCHRCPGSVFDQGNSAVLQVLGLQLHAH